MKKVIAGSIFALAMMGLAGTSLMQTNPPVQRTPRVGGIPTLTPMPTFTPVGGEPTATATVLEAATPTPTPSGAGAPTTTDEYKEGGWRTFTNPRFKNEGEPERQPDAVSSIRARTTRTAALRRCPRGPRGGPEARTRAE